MISEIYCYGGIDIYRDVFNAIAMLNGDRSFIQSLVTIGGIVGAFWSMVIMVGGDFVKPFLSWMIPMTIIQTVFLTPTKTVHLIDVVQTGRHETVDNVPYGLALMAGTLSRISHTLTQKTETFFTIPGDLKYSQTGGIFAANLLSNQKIMTIQDEDFAENMRSFIGQCVLYDLALGRKYTIKDLRNTNNIWGLISMSASPARSFLWKDNRNRGEIITCQEGVTRFTQGWSSAIDQAACAVGASLYPNKDATSMLFLGGGGAGEGNGVGVCRSPLAKQEFLRFLPIHYGVMASLSGNAGETLKQQMMISALVDAQDQASVMAGNASNFAARKAYLQQRSNYETIGKLASDTLPIMRAVLELICYSIFIFIMPLLVLPQGYKVLVSWSQTILWLSMWPPIYAILHLIMVSAISMKTKAYLGISNPHGITIASSLGAQNISADMATMAGYLSMSIPFICIAIVKGISSFVHMSSSLGAVSQGAATSASTEALTGNHQIGNTSMDNHSFNNVNMLNENYSGNVSSGNMRVQDGHVSITTSAHGGMIANVDQSNLPIAMNMAKTISSGLRVTAQKEWSMGSSKQQSAETSLASTVEDIGHLGRTLSNSTHIQEGWNETKQHQVGQAFQTVQSAVNKFATLNQISTGKAAHVMAEAGLRVFGMGGGASMTSSSEDRALIEKAKDFSKSESLESSARIAEDAMQHLSKNKVNDDIKSHLESHQKSLSKASRESESSQKHFENSKRLNKEADYTENNAMSINQNYNQKLIDYIAGHNAPNVSGTIGSREAVNILARNDDVTQAYVDRFVREHGPKQSFSTSEDSLKHDYDSTKISSVVDHDTVTHFNKEASSHIKHDMKAKAEGIEKRFDDKMNTTKSMFHGKKANMENQSAHVEQRYHDDKDNVGIKEAVMHGVSAALKANNEVAYAMKDMVQTGLQFAADYSNVALAKHPFFTYSSAVSTGVLNSVSEDSLKHDYDSTNIPSVVDQGVATHFNKEAPSYIKHDLNEKAGGIEGEWDEKMSPYNTLFHVEKVNMENQSAHVEQRYHDDKDNVGIKETAMHGVSAAVKANNEAAYAMKDAAHAGLQFTVDHSDVALAEHSSLTQLSIPQNEQKQNVRENQSVDNHVNQPYSSKINYALKNKAEGIENRFDERLNTTKAIVKEDDPAKEFLESLKTHASLQENSRKTRSDIGSNSEFSGVARVTEQPAMESEPQKKGVKIKQVVKEEEIESLDNKTNQKKDVLVSNG